MSQDNKPYVIEGKLFYPWKGQVRFQVKLENDKLVFEEGNDKNNTSFSNPTAITIRPFQEKELPLFEMMLPDIEKFVKSAKYATSPEWRNYSSPVIDFGTGRAKISVELKRIYL